MRDSLIVHTIIEEAKYYNLVFIVEEDVELLILYTALCERLNIYFPKPSKGKTPQKL